MLKDKTILLGVTGGIAAYKSAEIIRRLQKLKAETIVIMTASASKFITPLTLQVLSKNKVYLEMFEEFSYNPAHISLTKKADLLLIAPASANIIGKIASGIADDMLSTIVLALSGPIFIAPAMNDMMYKNPILQKNIKKLKDLGYYFIEPVEGDLACGAWGIGKMEEPEVILKEITNYFNFKKDLSEKKILITAGPTQEPIDKIRFISNYSSGKMGYLLAENALKRGAKVILISGPANLDPPAGAKFILVKTSQDMQKEVFKNYSDCDAVISAAAVSDFRPFREFKGKIKKSDIFNLKLIKNLDILEELGKNKKDKILIGFALETKNLINNAKSKLKNKNLDLIIANPLKEGKSGFNSDTNLAVLIYKNGNEEKLSLMSKKELADLILDKLVFLLNKG